MDNHGQTSAEFILLFGGIIVVVLLVIYINYINDLTGEISSNEVSEFNNQLRIISNFFK